jgi:LacI family transcriptional regulator
MPSSQTGEIAVERKRKRRISETGVQYGQVAEALREEIRRGIYDGLHAFPSLTQIMKRFGISRPCAAKSVAELKRMGLVVTIVGSGTHVKNRTIGVAIPGTADSEFFRAIQDTIRGSCRERGVEMVAGDFSKDHAYRAEEFVRLARHFVERKVAGVILQPIGFNAEAVKINRTAEGILNDAQIPIVLIDYDLAVPPKRSRHDLVAIDNFNAGRRIAAHLLSVGARRVACLLCRLSAESVWTRYAGVDDCLMRARGRAADRIIAVPDDEKTVAAGLKKFRPDAIVCSNDIAADRLLKTLKKLKVRVPAEVKVAGFDDVQIAGAAEPAITTIHQPCAKLAATAFQALMSRIDNPYLPPCQILLDAPLVVRASTGRRM